MNWCGQYPAYSRRESSILNGIPKTSIDEDAGDQWPLGFCRSSRSLAPFTSVVQSVPNILPSIAQRQPLQGAPPHCSVHISCCSLQQRQRLPGLSPKLLLWHETKPWEQKRSVHSLLLCFRLSLSFQRLLKLLKTRKKRWLVEMICSK